MTCIFRIAQLWPEGRGIPMDMLPIDAAEPRVGLSSVRLCQHRVRALHRKSLAAYFDQMCAIHAARPSDGGDETAAPGLHN